MKHRLNFLRILALDGTFLMELPFVVFCVALLRSFIVASQISIFFRSLTKHRPTELW